MAVAFDAVGPSSAGASSTASVTLSWSHTNVGSGVALVVGIAVGASSDSGLSVTVKLDPSGANTPFVALGSIVHTNAGTVGFIALFGLPNVSSGAHTITATVAGGTPGTMAGGSVSYTGADTTTAFSAQQSATGASATPSLTFTGSTAGNMVAGAVANGQPVTSMTAGTSRWIKNVDNNSAAGNAGGGDRAAGGSVALTWAVTADWFAIAAVEVLAASAAASIPFDPRRSFQQYRDPSETYFNQQDRRNANLVATAANPLVAPLDSAWQAGSRYWHLYDDWGSRRFYPQQRIATVDPAGAVVVAVPGPVPVPLWRRDPTPLLQRERESDPNLLGTALLEDPLLSGSDLDKRTNVPATHADRRMVPTQRIAITGPDDVVVAVPGPIPAAPWRRDSTVLQQRQLESPPGLLDAALLEDALLGGAETVKRTNVPATHADRRLVPQYTLRESSYGLLDTGLLEVPAGVPDLAVSVAVTHLRPGWLRQRLTLVDQSSQLSAPDFDPTQAGYPQTRWRRDLYPPPQRPYVSLAGLLDTALLEDVLLGGATTWWRSAVPATHGDRREVPQQRQALVDVSVTPTPADPTLSGWLVNWLADNRAATHADRRLVPLQRPYISDPSTYPTVAPADPLTLAWGAGGPLWHLYNDAALRDRRVVPQQRTYWVEIPAETDPVLVGWLPTRIARNVAAFSSRRLVPQQPKRESDPNLLLTALLEDALLGGADDLARHRAWYTDRRLYPQQRPVFAILGSLADPLLIVGGDWRRKLTPATHALRWVLRPWWQTQQFQGGALVLFQGVIVGGILAGPSATGEVRSGPGATGHVLVGTVDLFGDLYGDGYPGGEGTTDLGVTGTTQAGPGSTGKQQGGTNLTGGSR